MKGTCRFFGVLAVGASLGAACVTPPSPETESREQEIGSTDPGDPPPSCVTMPSCSLTYIGGYANSLQQQFGCSQSYKYWNGANAGFLGGTGSYCPSTYTIRNYLTTHNYDFVDSTYCDSCLTVPYNKLFVFWQEYWGPGCPSSCTTYPTPF